MVEKRATLCSRVAFDATLRLTRLLKHEMGYACPVCETPQRDGEHLAHHLAFTAMLHGDDHEAWLDDHVPDWADRDPAGLASAVTEYADATEYHEVFEDTAGGTRGRPNVDPETYTESLTGSDPNRSDEHGDGHGHAHEQGSAPRSSVRVPDPSELDPEAAAAVREARELTEEMYATEDSSAADASATADTTTEVDEMAGTDESDSADEGETDDSDATDTAGQ